MEDFLLSEYGMIVCALAAVSFCAGFLDSIAGGGGLIMLPALLLAGIPAQTALGTSKFAATFGTTVAAYNFIKNKAVVWRLVLYGIVFSLLGSYVGARSVLAIDEELVVGIIVGMLPVAMVAAFIPKRKINHVTLHWSKFMLYLAVPIVCFVLGFYDGFFGPGAGSLLILAFHLFFGVSLTAASGSAKIFNLTSNLGALVTFLVAGKCLMALAIPMAVTNILGNHVGSMLAIKKGDVVVRYVLIVSISILTISLVYKFFM